MSRAIYGMLLALCVGVFLAALPTAVSSSSGKTIVEMTDDCDQATFNADPPAGVGPGTCVGDGDVTFPEFLAEFAATGQVEEWEFDPGRDRVNSGDAIRAKNEGGETHSFTKVAAFGGGFIPPLNAFAGPTVDECQFPGVASSLVPPGEKSNPVVLPPGTYKFQCCIHPWMKSTITVRDRR